MRRTVPLPEDERWQPADPRDRIAEADTAREVWAALDELAPDQRAALVLVDLEGWPVEEAARILGVPSGTVKSRCARGRARLAIALGHLDPRPPARNQPAPPAVPDPAEPGPAAPRSRAGGDP